MTKTISLGSAVFRAEVTPEERGTVGEDAVGFVQKNRQKPRGAATAAALIVKAKAATGLS